MQALRRLTDARVGLARIGSAQSTADVLRFQHDHARARDAVHVPLDVDALRAVVRERIAEPLLLRTRAADRGTYLRVPDAGRRLRREDAQRLDAERPRGGCEVALVLADGLSSTAMHTQPAPFLDAWLPLVRARGWRLGPVTIVVQGRVAIGDEIGELLGAGTVVVLIGERPGLSAADSMGIYLTHAARRGRTDAERNCISNVRAGGLDHADAAATLTRLIDGARRLGRSGVDLKDDSLILDAHGPGQVESTPGA